MRVFVATDVRLVENEGRYYIVNQVASILQRYHDNFGKIVICSRRIHTDNLDKLIDVTEFICDVVAMDGLMDTFKKVNIQRMEKAMETCDLVIGRFHSFFACAAADAAKKLGKPFFAELMGDAWDAFWNHGLVGKAVAPYMYFKTKSCVWNADYALYVTNQFLQERYPCKNESVAASNVLISEVDSAVLERRLDRIGNMDGTHITLVTTAAVDVRYKGQEYVIRAIPLLNQKGLSIRYVLIGGGEQSYLRRVAQECGVEDQIEFTGRLSLNEVFGQLDEADIYIQPSLQEGLPRSVIEAMSRGCPAIGAKTAGIPELIAPECVIRRKSVQDVVDVVLSINNKDKLAALAKQNYEEACEYLDEVLTARRNAYYDKVKKDLGAT